MTILDSEDTENIVSRLFLMCIFRNEKDSARYNLGERSMNKDMEEWLACGEVNWKMRMRKTIWDLIIESHAPEFGLLSF